ncbi:MAG TPA: hypothetical protein DIW36_02510 [Ruminococcaceae bacterium]|nr:hypothetical protein [Oscillospiraceae bacterium]
MKKFLSILLSVSLLVCVLCSCNSGNNNISASVTTEEKTSTDSGSGTVQKSESTDITAVSEKTTTDNSKAGTSSKSQSSPTAKPAVNGSKTDVKTTTAKKITTTKKKTASNSSRSYTKYEVSPSSVTRYAGTVQRAWKVSSNGVSAEIHRVAYGSKITQNFQKSSDPGMDVSSKTVTYQPVCNIALISCSPTTVKFGVSQQLIGANSGRVENISKAAGALIAINGEASAPHECIRNGSIYSASQSESGGRYVRMYRNGAWDYGVMNSRNQNQLVSDGVYNTVRYQYTLVENGKAVYNNESGYYHNRTVLAQISANKYILAIGEFMPMDSIADLLVKYGVKNAVVLNGGNCSFMYVRGIGNVTGTRATQLKNLNKVNVVETEFFADNGMLGLNSAGKPKLGGPCERDIDIVYVK